MVAKLVSIKQFLTFFVLCLIGKLKELELTETECLALEKVIR